MGDFDGHPFRGNQYSTGGGVTVSKGDYKRDSEIDAAQLTRIDDRQWRSGRNSNQVVKDSYGLRYYIQNISPESKSDMYYTAKDLGRKALNSVPGLSGPEREARMRADRQLTLKASKITRESERRRRSEAWERGEN